MSKQRKIYALNLTYEVSSEEKDRAQKIILNLEHLLKISVLCDNHLDLIYTPFKDAQNITPQQVFQARAALRRYRDKVVENFNDFKRQAFKTFVLFQHFITDTQISKLSKSFVSAISDMEKQVNRFVDLFSNLESKDFSTGIVKAIENIKKELAQFKQIVEDRIIEHVQNNILARSWVDNVSDEIQQKVEKSIPFSVQLVNERNEKLKEQKENDR
jgi:uncharacterized protein (UPF0210 family)